MSETEQAVVKWLATVPGAKAAFDRPEQFEFAVLLYRTAEIAGYARGFAAGRADCAGDREKLRKIWEVFGE